MKATNFTHLHLHSEYSLLDGAIRFKKLASFVKKNGMNSVAMTDHGNMYGAVQFCEEMKSAGVKPIIGSEIYLAPGSRKEKKTVHGQINYYHLTLLAATEEGYNNLMKLSSIGYVQGFYRKPRIDKESLEKHSKGLIIGSACLQGEVAQYLLAGDKEKALETVHFYQNLVGKENFFIELMDHGLAEEKQIIRELADLAQETGALPVATNDAHYLTKADSEAHEVLLCMQTGKVLADTRRMKFGSSEFYVKTPKEMEKLFSWLPEAVTNSNIISDLCDFSVTGGGFLLPSAPMPKEFKTQGDYLVSLTEEGLVNRLGRPINAEERERLDHEFEIINGMGFAGYFLIVSELMRWARRNDIPVGPGRGSAAASLVSFAVDITDVNPLDYALSFERFLNPARAQMPDIDLDVCVERRGEIIDHLKDLYGEDSVCQIITYSRLKKRAVIKDVARVLGISISDGDRLSKLIGEAEDEKHDTIEKIVKSNVAVKTAIKSIENADKLIEYAIRLAGLVRHAGIHAGGVVIAPGKLDNYAPLFWKKDKGITTQYDMKAAEKIGLLKLDVLGLRTVTVLHHAEQAIRKNKPDFELNNLPFNDKETLAMISSGETTAVFQVESTGMRGALKKIGISRFDDLTAAVAIYRPGSMHMIDIYAANKEKAMRNEVISYAHPALEEVLKDTYGVIVYQEQVMQIANVMAGMSLAEADNLRRAMSKKIASKMEAMKTTFITGAADKQIPKKKALEIWDFIKKFAEYGFNKGHTVCYAILAYRTAFLKRHYPAEFMAACLTSEIGTIDKLRPLVKETSRLGVTISPPSVNSGCADFFASSPTEVVYSIAAIKNVGYSAALDIEEARRLDGSFSTIFELCSRVALVADSTGLNKRSLEALILSGATDCLDGNRAQQLKVVDQALSYGISSRKQKDSGQMSLFGDVPEEEMALPALTPIPEILTEKRLELEKEMLGYYFSGHPLDVYAEEVSGFTTLPLQKLEGAPLGFQSVAGAVSEIRKISTKRGVMAFVTLTDRETSSEVIIFSDTLEKYEDLLEKGALLLFDGTVTEGKRDRDDKLIIDRILPLKDARKYLNAGVMVELSGFDCKTDLLEETNLYIRKNPGRGRLVLKIKFPSGRVEYLSSMSVKIEPSNEFLTGLRKILPDSSKVFLSRNTGRYR